MINKIKKRFNKWGKKNVISIGNNRQYKIVGCGNTAFKVLKFEPQPELGNKGGWSQVFWKFSDITPETTAYQVIKKMEKKIAN